MSAAAVDPARIRQVLYWRLLAATFDLEELAPGLASMTRTLAQAEGLPPSVLDAKTGIDTLLERHPELAGRLERLGEFLVEAAASDVQESVPVAPENGQAAPHPPAELHPTEAAKGRDSEAPATGGDEPEPEPEPGIGDILLFGKVLLNVFGPAGQGDSVTAQQYHRWQQDVGHLETLFGFAPGSLAGGGPTVLPGPGGGAGGHRPLIDDAELAEELLAMESDLIRRMDLREALNDDRLAAKIPLTLPVIEQLFHDKGKLTGPALANAKRIIKAYVDKLAAVLRKEVMRTTLGALDRSQPPRRVFRNLDLARTVWKNLPNYHPRDGRLYVDRLYYKHRARKELMKYFIVVVDQSGSMIDAMTQCAILASIFAGLPTVDVVLIAFDTAVIDLTPWAQDPFEALMRTNLGGGNDGPLAMEHARAHIQDPRRTTMVWISDFYEHRALMPMIREVVAQGVHFIPVGSVSGTGYFSVDAWFRKQFEQIGHPVFTGNIKKLIAELKGRLI